MMRKGVCLFLKVVLVLALLNSLFLVYEHYKITPTKFCKFGENFDCGIVNKSPYANVDGVFYLMYFNLGWDVPLLNIPVPVSAVGALVFLFALVSVCAIEKKKHLLRMNPLTQVRVLKWLITLSILFALYLVYVEAFVLVMWCIFCLALDVLILLALIGVCVLEKNVKKEKVYKSKKRREK